MNYFSYEDMHIGLNASFTVQITAEMLHNFCLLSGDSNPLHCDLDFAKSLGYSGCVVFGMLEAAFYSKLAGVYLPGKYCLLQEVNSKFCAPVYVDDILTISGIVKSRHDLFRRVEIKAEIHNQNGIRVSKAILKAGVHERG